LRPLSFDELVGLYIDPVEYGQCIFDSGFFTGLTLLILPIVQAALDGLVCFIGSEEIIGMGTKFEEEDGEGFAIVAKALESAVIIPLGHVYTEYFRSYLLPVDTTSSSGML
jgi:hypothetical protein